jgi:hypothetical protein
MARTSGIDSAIRSRVLRASWRPEEKKEKKE